MKNRLGTIAFDAVVVASGRSIAVITSQGASLQDFALALPEGCSITHPRDSSEVEAVFIVLAEASSSAWSRARAQLAIREYLEEVPVFLIPLFPPADLWKLGSLDSAVLLVSELPQIDKVLREAVPGEPLRSLLNRVERRPMDPVLRSAVRLLFSRRPTAFGDGGSIPTVQEMADWVGVEKGYLYRKARAAGVDIGELVRQVRFLRGLQLRRVRSYPWLRVALTLGFNSHAAWGNFSSRVSGVSPGKAAQVPLHQWVAAAAVKVLEGCE